MLGLQLLPIIQYTLVHLGYREFTGGMDIESGRITVQRGGDKLGTLLFRSILILAFLVGPFRMDGGGPPREKAHIIKGGRGNGAGGPKGVPIRVFPFLKGGAEREEKKPHAGGKETPGEGGVKPG